MAPTFGGVGAAQRADIGDEVVDTLVVPREAVDPVRFLGNRSSGKMGYAIAEAAQRRGARVILVTAPTALHAPYNCEVVNIVTTGFVDRNALNAWLLANDDLQVRNDRFRVPGTFPTWRPISRLRHRLQIPIEERERLLDRMLQLGPGPAVAGADEELDPAGYARGRERIRSARPCHRTPVDRRAPVSGSRGR